MDPDNDDTTYRVLRNDEEQYSTWPVDREMPPGWHEEGTAGSKADCLAHIESVWTDMRPRSLRLWMEAQSTSEAS